MIKEYDAMIKKVYSVLLICHLSWPTKVRFSSHFTLYQLLGNRTFFFDFHLGFGLKVLLKGSLEICQTFYTQSLVQIEVRLK